MRCAWCSGSLAGLRRDARFCSQRCRQAAHRFGAGAPGVARARPTRDAGEARRFAYADPPYPGRAHYYAGHPDFAGEVDHRALVEQLVADYPDGWALSTAADRLQEVLEWCPRTVRVAAWVRGERPTSSWAPLSSWEPVVFAGGRRFLSGPAERRVDSLVAGVAPRTTDPGRVIGAKPAAFCYWLFELLGARPGDELVDLFPGSGGVARAWAEVNRHAHQVDGSARAGGDASPEVLHDASDVATVDG